MERKIRVVPYQVKLYCDNCGVEMVRRDYVCLSYPLKYSYKCPECGACEDSYTVYPYVEYEEVLDD